MSTFVKKMLNVFVLLIFIGLANTACFPKQNRELKIGILTLLPAMEPIVTGFKEGMEEQGYMDGVNISYIYDGPANEVDKLNSLAEKLVANNVNIILAVTTPGGQAAQRAVQGSDIPIVFVAVTDPVASGLVSDLNTHPENITGILAGTKSSLSEGRRLEVFLQVVPNIKSLYMPFNPDDPAAMESVESVRKAASLLGVSLVEKPVKDESQAIAATTPPEGVDGVFLPSDRLIGSMIENFIQEANAANLPTTLNNPAGLQLGALVAYGPDFESMGKQSARLTSQIISGVPASTLPVEVPDLLIGLNLSTAEKIGLELPDNIIRLASIIVR